MPILRDINAEHLVLEKGVVIEGSHLSLRLDIKNSNVSSRVTHEDDCTIFGAEHADTGDEAVVLVAGLLVETFAYLLEVRVIKQFFLHVVELFIKGEQLAGCLDELLFRRVLTLPLIELN